VIQKYMAKHVAVTGSTSWSWVGSVIPYWQDAARIISLKTAIHVEPIEVWAAHMALGKDEPLVYLPHSVARAMASGFSGQRGSSRKYYMQKNKNTNSNARKLPARKRPLIARRQ